MAEEGRENEAEVVEDGVKEMKIESQDSGDEASGTIRVADIIMDSASESRFSSPRKTSVESTSWSQMKSETEIADSIAANDEHVEKVGGEITVKQEPGQPPKLARSTSQKVITRSAPLFDHYPDKTEEATNVFQVITQCTYSAKYLGSTEHAMECDCTEEWDSVANVNHACGEDSDCINRATKMECYGDCGCGSACENQRFQQQRYANVSVIKTEKKGYGLRADSDLHPNEFIFEYIGEVIHEGQFRKRMHQYDDEGIKHFYFMSLSKGEFVDATKRGNLGRFCNHSCNPNCYVDKWVVGDKLRMGIFAERNIQAGEELVFNYNVDRYGADPQPCYCGEPNCTGFIGGKTQTERATKLSNATIEALGIDDGDGWDTAIAKKPRKKKAGEDDEEYVNNVQPKGLDEDGVTKVMATLLQCKEKWIAVKLLGRIQRCEDERVISRVVKMHGYQILNSALSTWKDDCNVVLQILDILDHFPRLTRNKISDSKIEGTVESLKGSGDERVDAQAKALLTEWSTLEVAYRIPRKKREPTDIKDEKRDKDRPERRESIREDRDRRGRSKTRSRSRSRSRSLDAPRGPSGMPTGPRNGVPPRNAPFYPPRPPFRPPRPSALPAGWFTAMSDGKPYYYSASGQTSWTRPTMPANQPPPPPKPVPANKALEDIINEITNAKANTPSKETSTVATPQPAAATPKKEKKENKEKWRSYSEEKQKKLYENTLFPHIKHVVDKYKSKLPKDDLKRFAKEVSKKLVNSDYKNHRVEDPTKINDRQERNVKKYVKEYFDKAVSKRREHDKKKKERKAREGGAPETSISNTDSQVKKEDESDNNDIDNDDDGLQMSDDDIIKDEPKSITPITPMDQITNGDGLKRKRESEEGTNGVKIEGEDSTPSKRARSMTPPPAPPPPPPPADAQPDDDTLMENLANYENDLKNGNVANGDGAMYIELPVDEAAIGIVEVSAPPPAIVSIAMEDSKSDLNDERSPKLFQMPPTPNTQETDNSPEMERGDNRMKSDTE